MAETRRPHLKQLLKAEIKLVTKPHKVVHPHLQSSDVYQSDRGALALLIICTLRLRKYVLDVLQCCNKDETEIAEQLPCSILWDTRVYNHHGRM